MDITNKFGVSLPAAIWLLHDEYEYFHDSKYFSATTLLKPIKQIVLAKRVPANLKQTDLIDFMNVRYGTAVHDSTEIAMRRGAHKALKTLGYPQEDIDRFLVNPTPEEMAKHANPVVVWVENRVMKKVLGYTIGGKYDLIFDGTIHDWKTAKVFSWIAETNDWKYRMQLSIYRWMNPDKVFSDVGNIQHFFKDWMAGDAAKNPRYPQAPILEKEYPLFSIPDTQAWVEERLRLIQTNMEREEKFIPECTPEDLWMRPPTYKYFSNPEKTDGRATRVSENLSEMQAVQAEKGGKGVIITIKSEAKACGYCNAAPVCQQRKAMFPDQP